jgi:hypothetical protein
MCGDNQSDAEVLKTLNDIQTNPEFEKWNMCSLQHIIRWAGGCRGQAIRELSLIAYDQYFAWYLKHGKTCHKLSDNDFVLTIDQFEKLRTVLTTLDQYQE